METIDTRDDLRRFAAEHGLRSDWHEPDEQGVTAVVKGRTFDNAGFWPLERAILTTDTGRSRLPVEKYVVLKVDGKSVAAVNLATLFAWAAEGGS